MPVEPTRSQNAAAGHFAGHHGLLGAVAGCAIGHHEANKQENAAQNSH